MYVSGSVKTQQHLLPSEFEKQASVKLRYHKCPACGSSDISIIYSIEDVPAHSVLLMPTYRTAVTYPKGDIYLGFCNGCEFISNYGFEPALLEYSSHYEESQGFSETFNLFHVNLAKQLIDRYDLHNKDIVEIGCGKGDFLTLLCEIGKNRGVGFDPAYVKSRNTSIVKDRMTFVEDFYSQKYTDIKCDFVCCKMTLEHIHDVYDFLSTLWKGIYKQKDAVVFFQIPDVDRIVEEGAFWDIYYEHCSYFSEKSLVNLFENCGFEVMNIWRDFGSQYLMIEAKCAEKGQFNRFFCENNEKKDLNLLKNMEKFRISLKNSVKKWKDFLEDCDGREDKVVLWGSGSKGTSFLNTLGLREEIECVVDINSYRWGTYMPGTGQEIVRPEFLKELEPDVVIIMNPVYLDEIKSSLSQMGLSPQVVTL